MCVYVTEKTNPPSEVLPTVRDGVSRDKAQYFPQLRVVFQTRQVSEVCAPRQQQLVLTQERSCLKVLGPAGVLGW